MKKSLMNTILTLIANDTSDDAELVRTELTAELAKGEAKAEANRAVYAEIHDKVVQALTDATNPVTAQEIADEIGVARGKIVYGLTHYWSDEVVADKSGKTTTYALA